MKNKLMKNKLMKNKLKIILLSVVCLLFLSPVYGEDRIGTIISAPVTVGSSANTFPAAYQDEIHGGYKVVTTLAERNAITPERRALGMPCYVIDEDKMYRLVGGIGNEHWVEVSTVLTETDPVYTPSPASGITGANISNWDTAHTERRQWDGGLDNLDAAIGRASLGLGSLATLNAETDPKVGSLTQNYISKWGPSALTDSLIYDDGTSVGIGVVGPGYKLDVDGDVNIASGKKYKINGDDLSALDVPYANTDYPTVAAALDRLLYVAPVITSFTNNINQIEIGSTMNSTPLNWNLNKVVTSLSLGYAGTTIVDPTITVSSTTYTHADTYSTDRTYTLTVSDGTTEVNASTSIYFRFSRYWGVSPNPALDSAGINALTNELSTTRVQTRSMSPSNQYIYIVYPAAWGTATFVVGGLTVDWILSVQDHTNASGHIASYNVYRSPSPLTGDNYNVQVN